jgi:hypothetical protein
MIVRSALNAVGGYRPDYEPAEDFDLWLRLAEVGELAVLPGRLLRYRVHPNSVSKTRARQQGTAQWRALIDAVRRRKYPLRKVPFVELADDDQVDWIELAIAAGASRFARLWAVRRLASKPSWRTLKQAVKAALPRSQRVIPIMGLAR